MPQADRDDLYWTLLGNVQLASGDAELPLKAWRRLTEPTPQLKEKIEAVARHHVAELYNAGDHAGVLAVVTKGVLPGWQAGDVPELASIIDVNTEGTVVFDVKAGDG